MYLFSSLSMFSVHANAHISNIARLKNAYPTAIVAVSNDAITWADGTKMSIYERGLNKTSQDKLDNPRLLDQINEAPYQRGIPSDPTTLHPSNNSGRIRYEPFFRKMYGNSEAEVEEKLVTIYWMPTLFGLKYPLRVTTVNDVYKKLTKISHELELLVSTHPEYKPFLDNPGGTFKWRMIANTTRLSAHSFGMTIDINSRKSDYWQWNLKSEKQPILEEAPLVYHNQIPLDIIPIFERQGFIWGGKWAHYDTMHFEYRPELFL